MTKAIHSDHGDFQDAIRRRAEEIYNRSGRIAGRDLDNWAQAEQEVRRERIAAASRRAVVIKIQGVEYTGEYDIESAQGYSPGEFGEGMTIPVRFEGARMFVTRPNGVELETTLVKKVG